MFSTYEPRNLHDERLWLVASRAARSSTTYLRYLLNLTKNTLQTFDLKHPRSQHQDLKNDVARVDIPKYLGNLLKRQAQLIKVAAETQRRTQRPKRRI